jgi:hypothetical protein
MVHILFQAIAQCIAAAGSLFQAVHQKELMRAAKFGNSFLQVKFPSVTSLGETFHLQDRYSCRYFIDRLDRSYSFY